MQGLLHETSLQAAQERQTSLSAASAIVQKRSRSNNDAELKVQTQTAAAKGPIHFQRATSVPGLPAGLSASRIVNIEVAQGPSEWSQRRLIAATPTSTHDAELSLAHPTYDLPIQLVRNFTSLGIKQIYPWQKNCLKGPGLLTGQKNLVYCAPTGGGKSLVAELLMLKRILDKKGTKALLVLPYVALVQEKVRWLRNVTQGLRYTESPDEQQQPPSIWRQRVDKDTVRVVGFFGGGNIRSTWADFDIGVCTMEKANALINTAIVDCSISSLKSVVLDELHMIDDDHRGYLLELMTTKLLSLDQSIQIIAMSATLPVC